jgi:hypothetical protein
MGVLTAAMRNKLPASKFALPGRRYPVPDKAHANNALARVSQHGSPAEKSAVRAKVKKLFSTSSRKSNPQDDHDADDGY